MEGAVSVLGLVFRLQRLRRPRLMHLHGNVAVVQCIARLYGIKKHGNQRSSSTITKQLNRKQAGAEYANLLKYRQYSKNTHSQSFGRLNSKLKAIADHVVKSL